MPDPRFYLTSAPMTAQAAAKAAGAVLASAPDGKVARAGSVDEADVSDAIVFVEKASHASKLAGRKVGLCLADEALAKSLEIDGPVAVMGSPRLGFARVAGLLHSERPFEAKAGIHPSAKVAADVTLGAGVIIGEDAEIGEGGAIGPN
ncbi:MAG TPA: hypothetical protein PK585_09640, partial [Amphiplicatus sp.]|nr:hypothetical protein [Amphiplicatus sp.]